MIQLDKVTAGMVLYDRHRELMGNTTLRSIGEWRVTILSVHIDEASMWASRDYAMVSWNGNRPEKWSRKKVEKLFSWSMWDDGVEVTRGMWDCVIKVKRRKA